jgi:multidrug efflux pump subunit AcrA (membrane-fusion protein)
MTGLESGDMVEIASGLQPGETVIVSGQNGLPDGAKVTVGK